MRNLHRTCLALPLLAAACTQAPDAGTVEEESGVSSATTNRWYGPPGQINRVQYFADPGISADHWAAVWDALQEYNAITPLDFEPGCSGTTRDHAPTCLPPSGQAREPRVIYADVTGLGEGGRTFLRSTYDQGLAASPPDSDSQLLTPLAAVANNRFRTAGSYADGSFRHQDYIVVFESTKTLAVRTALHETGHVLNMEHEQRRSDSPVYLNIYPCCATGVSTADVPVALGSDVFLAPFDPTSLMEYPSGNRSGCYDILAKFPVFTVGTLPTPVAPGTMASCTPYTFNSLGSVPIATEQSGWLIPRPEDLSAEDINVLYQMYPPALGNDEPGNHFGHAMATGDFDEDGYDDLAVGAPQERPGDGRQTGVVFLYKGTYTGLMPWFTLEPPAAANIDGARFGEALAAADLDGDGDAELAVGAPGALVGPAVEGGAVFVYHGGSPGGPHAPAMLARSLTSFPPPLPFEHFGETLAIGGFAATFSGGTDSVRHVVKRLAVGIPSRGVVELYSLSGSTFTRTATFTGSDSGSSFGQALAARDLDGNGLDELVIGAPGSRRAFVITGGNSGLSTTMATITDPFNEANSRFGEAVAVVDLEGGKPLVVVGAPGHSADRGRAYIFDRSFGLRRIAQPADFQFDGTNSRFGAALAAADFGGNGKEHLVIGAPRANSGSGELALYHWDGSSIAVGHFFGDRQGDEPGSRYGSSFAAGRFQDRYGDGPVDLAIGQPRHDDGAGALWILHGHADANVSYVPERTPSTTHLTQGKDLSLLRR